MSTDLDALVETKPTAAPVTNLVPLDPPVRFLAPRIRIDAPAINATLAGVFAVSGTASCDLMEVLPDESVRFVRNASDSITGVTVRLGAGAAITATATGPSSARWTSWQLPVSVLVNGALEIRVDVNASGIGAPGIATDTRSVRVDVSPPTISIDPTADVWRVSPPYVAIITGTATDNAAGVAAIEWQLGSGAFQGAVGTNNWSTQVTLPSLGLHTVNFRARDHVGNLSPVVTTQVRAGDITAPSLNIVAPLPNETFTMVNGQVSVDLRGTASDTQSGVARVEWSLDGGAFTQATPKAPGDWSTWSASVPVFSAGNRVLTVRATDLTSPSNTLQLQRGFVAAEPFQPADPEAVFSPAAYLDDLLNFTTQRTKTASGGTLVTRQQLVDSYLQSFIELTARSNRTVANQSVSQVRLCIEVLRRYLAKFSRPVPESAEAAYCQAAYSAMLRQLGTSFDEMRLARVASEPARAALASRLGLGAATSRLNQLLLHSTSLTEVALKTLFGLEETTVKPLVSSLLPEPLLLTWQKEQLRVVWRQQDDVARSAFDTTVPVIDPDLLSMQDLRSTGVGNVAFDLWKARGDALTAYTRSLDTTRKAQATQRTGFDVIVSGAVGNIGELVAMDESRRRGNSIDAQLRPRRLTLQAFIHLMRVRQLAVASSVQDAEWADIYAILTQVKKLVLYPTWRAEEQGLILGPDLFQMADPARAPVVTLPQWRANPQAREAWRRVLESRIQQQQTLAEAMQAAVSSAEEAALPLLRDACIAAIAADRAPALIADRLTQELCIDCKDSGHRRTTRAQQALETLQAVLLSLRTGRFKAMESVLGMANATAAWVLALDASRPYSEADFDEEWRWMGGYATWNAAIRVFAYPEIYLLPELRPAGTRTREFDALLNNLRNQARLNVKQAREFAAAYLDDLTKRLGEALPAPLRHPALQITDQLTDTQLAARRQLIEAQFGGIATFAQAPGYLQEIFYFVPLALALHLQKSGQYLEALDWIETFYTDHFAIADRKIYRGLYLEEKLSTQYQRNPDNWLRVGLNPHEIATVRAYSHTRFTVLTLVRCYLDFGDAEFTRDEGEALARARALYATALELLALPEMQPSSGPAGSPFPPNPVPQALRLRAELNLLKLRSGRNIAGIERQQSLITQPALTLDSLLVVRDSQRAFRPTPYRYGVLIERAKNLVNIAQQVEQSFLAALEKRDAEVYNLIKASHDLELAGATMSLQALRVKEANEGVVLAERQLDRAVVQRDSYQELIDAGLNRWEESMIEDYHIAGRYRNLTAVADAALTSAQAFASGLSGGFLGTGLGAGLGAALGVAALSVARAYTQIEVNRAETSAQINSATASFERRAQEWELQRQFAESEMAIGTQQVALAQAHTQVTRQEELISRTQHEHAEATVEFLAQKFTSAELYAWMSNVLRGAYNYFLQQATAMAQLAQYQLGFERQETPPAFIKADYWDTTDDADQPATAATARPDRQGLTGSIRLLQDITRLDQFAFDTNRRKLQLSETFSLARLLPLEFQQFRDSGQLPFATPMALFDRGFPGHYLRLIKRVRISIVALVPPVQGVRATLIASGISRVVSGGDTFQNLIVRRDPELIAFTSTSNASGVLELEPEAGMLLPFESMGVDTNWELQLPKAANQFDYRSISDVLFTVEYTALQDFSYRQQVIRQLDNRLSAERVISIRDQFADQWYALHNPEGVGAPMKIEFTLSRQEFPPNIDELRIQQLVLAVIRAPDAAFEIAATSLTFTAQGSAVAVGGTIGGTADGIISTRRGNASTWIPILGKSPAGRWELTLPDTPEMRNRFKNEEIDDLLLVLTYEGRTAAWPL